MDEFKDKIIENLSINKLIKVHNICNNNGIIPYRIIDTIKKKKKYPKYLTHQPILFKEKIPKIKPLTPRTLFFNINFCDHNFNCKRKTIEIYNSPEFDNNIFFLSKVVLIKELNDSLTKEVIKRIFKCGEFSNKIFFPKWQNFLKKIKFLKYNPKIKIYNIKKIINIIFDLSNLISIETIEDKASYVIMNSPIAYLIKEYIKEYKTLEISHRNIHKIGKIGNLNIFVDPYMQYNDDRICVGSVSFNNNIGIALIIKDIEISNIYNGYYNEKIKLCINYTLENVGGELCKLKYKTVDLDIKI